MGAHGGAYPPEAARAVLAAELKRVREVLAPRPPASPLDCAPSTVADQVECNALCREMC